MNIDAKIALTVPEACDAIGVGRTKLYSLANAGRIDMRKVDGRTLVTAESLRRLIAEAAPALPAN